MSPTEPTTRPTEFSTEERINEIERLTRDTYQTVNDNRSFFEWIGMITHNVDNPSVELIRAKFFGYRLGVTSDQFGLELEEHLIKLVEDRNTTIIPERVPMQRSSKYKVYVITEYRWSKVNTIIELLDDHDGKYLNIVIIPRIEDKGLVHYIKNTMPENARHKGNDDEIIQLTKNMIDTWKW